MLESMVDHTGYSAEEVEEEEEEEEGDGDEESNQYKKKPNTLPLWGNLKTMNLNALILTNIQSSTYFKVNLYELKTFHEVIDEIYYKVTHLEPWEKGSRKTAGQTGMCGGVRGVGTGGIVSTAFCILYKLFTLRLSRKQLMGLVNHHDSPYIRGLGFMYIRYTQPPADLWEWYEPYLDDAEEIDCKAGGGLVLTVGEMLRQWLGKLEWFSTLFPRIPVPVQKQLEEKLREKKMLYRQEAPPVNERIPDDQLNWGEAERVAANTRRTADADQKRDHGEGHSRGDRGHDRRGGRDEDKLHERSRAGRSDAGRDRHRDKHSERSRDHHRDRKRSRSRSSDRRHGEKQGEKHGEKHGEKQGGGSRDRVRSRATPERRGLLPDVADEIARERERQRREKNGGGGGGKRRSRSRSRESQRGRDRHNESRPSRDYRDQRR